MLLFIKYNYTSLHLWDHNAVRVSILCWSVFEVLVFGNVFQAQYNVHSLIPQKFSEPHDGCMYEEAVI